MGRGRKPKPTRLKILTGNPGKRAIPEGEPSPQSGTPEMPEFLTATARKHWEYFAELLAASGLLALVDRMSFAALCQACGDYEDAVRLMAATPAMLLGADNAPVMLDGSIQPNPAYITFRVAVSQAERRMHSWSSEFGLTPAVRARMGAVTNKPQADPFEEFLARGKKSG